MAKVHNNIVKTAAYLRLLIDFNNKIPKNLWSYQNNPLPLHQSLIEKDYNG